MTFYHLNRHRTRIDGNAICALHLRYRFAIPSLLLRYSFAIPSLFLRFCSAIEPIWNGRKIGLTRELLGRKKGGGVLLQSCNEQGGNIDFNGSNLVIYVG